MQNNQKEHSYDLFGISDRRKHLESDSLTIMVSCGSDDSQQSVGEKMFLEHLSEISNFSQEVGNDTTERDANRIGTMSVGEELWLVHCRRSQGVEFELDEEVKISMPPKEVEHLESSGHRIETRGSDKILHLRNRDVKIH